MIQFNIGKGCNTKKYDGKFRRELLRILEIDPVGPIFRVCNQLNANSSLHPQHIAKAMRREAQLGNGQYYEKNHWWWKPKKRRVQWHDNVFYVTKEEDVLLGWVRHRRCDSYRIFILLSEESHEVFFAKLYGWHYVPTGTEWDDLESKDVIAHLEW